RGPDHRGPRRPGRPHPGGRPEPGQQRRRRHPAASRRRRRQPVLRRREDPRPEGRLQGRRPHRGPGKARPAPGAARPALVEFRRRASPPSVSPRNRPPPLSQPATGDPAHDPPRSWAVSLPRYGARDPPRSRAFSFAAAAQRRAVAARSCGWRRPMNDPDLKAKVLELLDAHRIMAVATLRPDGWPQATMVGYIHDDLTLYFAVARTSQKFANIERDHRVSIAIGRDGPNTISGLSMAARAFEVTDFAEIERLNRLLHQRYPEQTVFAPRE